MAPIADSRSKYYTGEAYWALARLHRLFPDDGFGAVADRIGNYLATRRDDVEDHWPPVPDHWVAYALAETVQFPERDRRHPLTAAELAYVRSQAGSFGAQVRWVSQQAGPWGVAVRGTHVPRGGGYGVVGEALTGFWRVAEADDRLADLRGPLADRAECIAGLAIDRQVRDGPVAADGAWFIGDLTRMDDQQHATSALLRTTAIVDSTPAPGHPAPSAWLWAVALLALLDPLAIGMAVPTRPRRADRATLAAAGAAIGAVIVVVAALVGEPLFDALGVSRPAARLAVGARRRRHGHRPPVPAAPRPQDGLAGWRAALVPVAIPLTASPALVLLGLSAGADLGAVFVAGVLAIGVGLVDGRDLRPRRPAPGARSPHGDAGWSWRSGWRRASCSSSTPCSTCEPRADDRRPRRARRRRLRRRRDDEAAELLAAAPDPATLESVAGPAGGGRAARVDRRARRRSPAAGWRSARASTCRDPDRGAGRPRRRACSPRAVGPSTCAPAAAPSPPTSSAAVAGARVVGVDIDPVAALMGPPQRRRRGGRRPRRAGARSLRRRHRGAALRADRTASGCCRADVVRLEPRRALDGGADGLDVARRVVDRGGAPAAPGGWLVIELGGDQDAALRPDLDAGVRRRSSPGTTTTATSAASPPGTADRRRIRWLSGR